MWRRWPCCCSGGALVRHNGVMLGALLEHAALTADLTALCRSGAATDASQLGELPSIPKAHRRPARLPRLLRPVSRLRPRRTCAHGAWRHCGRVPLAGTAAHLSHPRKPLGLPAGQSAPQPRLSLLQSSCVRLHAARISSGDLPMSVHVSPWARRAMHRLRRLRLQIAVAAALLLLAILAVCRAAEAQSLPPVVVETPKKQPKNRVRRPPPRQPTTAPTPQPAAVPTGQSLALDPAATPPWRQPDGADERPRPQAILARVPGSVVVVPDTAYKYSTPGRRP